MSDVIPAAIEQTGYLGVVPKLDNIWYEATDKPQNKIADWAWKMRRSLAPGDQDHPQVVLEVGTSEPARKLAKDAEHWLTQSAGAVTIMLTLDIAGSRADLKSWIVDATTGKVSVEATIEAQADQDWKWRLTGPTAALRYSVQRAFGQEPKEGYSDAIVITFEDLQQALDAVSIQKTDG